MVTVGCVSCRDLLDCTYNGSWRECCIISMYSFWCSSYVNAKSTVMMLRLNGCSWMCIVSWFTWFYVQRQLAGMFYYFYVDSFYYSSILVFRCSTQHAFIYVHLRGFSLIENVFRTYLQHLPCVLLHQRLWRLYLIYKEYVESKFIYTCGL